MDELQSMIEGCRRNDEHWQQRLYEVYSPRFFALCLRLATSREEAEDMLVEGFYKILLHIHSYRGEGSFEGWMHRIFIHVATNHFRRSGYRHETRADDQQEEPPAAQTDNSVTIDVQTATRQAMQLLSPDERLAFNLVAVDGYSLAEAATALNKPLGTVKSCYFRAKETMTHELKLRLGRDYLSQ